MALSILILCICSMTSFNVVASRRTTEPTTTTERPYSGPLLDFGFSRLIDDLVSANDSFTNRKAIFAIFAEVENQLKPLSGSRSKSLSEFIRPDMENEMLNKYLASARSIEKQYNLIGWYSMDENYDAKTLKRVAKDSSGFMLWDTTFNFKYTDEDTGLSFMKLLIENTKNKSADACSYVKQSRQYEIYEIYHKLVITTVKLFAMRIYASHLLKKYSDKEEERTSYQSTLSVFNNVAVPAMIEASREMFSCDGTEKRKEFIELKWLFNPISINEIYLKEDSPRCWGTCPDYENATFHQYDPQPDINQCPGRLYNCFRETVDVCDPSANYYKRYTDYSYGGDLARRNNEKKSWCTRKSKRPYIENGAFDRCDKCICYCADQDRSDIVRRFSLRAVESDTSKNKVITGIQFVEKNQTIYLSIQEGELRPNGTIDKSTVQWQPVNEIDWKSPFITEYDYVTITHDLKSVNLDTLFVSNDRVLTGIRLEVQGSHLALKIKSNAFSYSTGILQGEFWQSLSPVPRQEITMTAPDSPFFMDQSVVDTRENTYVTFQKTDYEKDAAQTTVPVIDALPVVSDPPVPLSGVGIYYNGQTGYGGFIGFKAVTYDFPKVIGH